LGYIESEDKETFEYISDPSMLNPFVYQIETLITKITEAMPVTDEDMERMALAQQRKV